MNWTRYTVRDTANGGMPAAAFDIPQDWTPDSRVLWNPAQPQSPVQLFAMATAPDGITVFETLPWQAFGWSNPPMPFAVPGQNLNGIVQMQPVAPEAAIRQLLIPAWRGRAPGLEILGADVTQLDAPYDARVPNALTSAHALKARIAWDQNGRRIEEIFHATMPVITVPPAGWGMPSMTSWQMTDIMAFRAPMGELDAAHGVFERIQRSWQIEPNWKALVQQRISGLIHQAGAHTDQLLEQGRRQTESFIRSSNEFIQRGRDYVAGQQARVDAMASPVYTGTSATFSASKMMGGDGDSGGGSTYTSHDQAIDSIYERQTVDNPANSANDKITSHVDYVWKDHNGNLQGSNDPNFDPNTGTEFGNWTRATVKRPG